MQNSKQILIEKYKNLRDDIIQQKKNTFQNEIQQKLNFIDQHLYKTPQSKDDCLNIQEIADQIFNLESLILKLDQCMVILQKKDNFKKKIKKNKYIQNLNNCEELEDQTTRQFNWVDCIEKDQNVNDILINQQNFQPKPTKTPIIEDVKKFLLPQPFNNAHIYSVCLLNDEKHVGLCLGESHPFVIFDLQQSKIVQTISVKIGGVLDAITINKEQDIVIGCTKSIHILKNIDNQYVLREQEFDPARDCPSRLIQQNDRVFSTNYMSQLGEGGSCIQMWDLKSMNGSIFKMEKKTSGALVIDGYYLLAGNQINQIEIWHQELNDKPSKTLKCEELVTSLRLVREGLVVGGGKKKLFTWKWNHNEAPVSCINYEFDNLNTRFIVEIMQNLTVGDNQGSIKYYFIKYYIQIDIVMINKNNQKQVILFKMRQKVMMVQIGNTIGISGSYDGSFFSFRIKNE